MVLIQLILIEWLNSYIVSNSGTYDIETRINGFQVEKGIGVMNYLNVSANTSAVVTVTPVDPAKPYIIGPPVIIPAKITIVKNIPLNIYLKKLAKLFKRLFTFGNRGSKTVSRTFHSRIHS